MIRQPAKKWKMLHMRHKEERVMQKPEALEDVRVRRTRKLIQQAFIELTVEKGFAALTVRDITERAMINRSTFYRHYLDKYDLLDQYMKEVHALSDEPVLEEKLAPTAQEAPSGLINLLKHIQQSGDFYRVMLGPQGDALFTQRFRQNTEQRFRPLFDQAGTEQEPGSPPPEFLLKCLSYAGVGGTVWWLEQEQPCSPEQLAIWFGQLSSSIVGPDIKSGGTARDERGMSHPKL
jgi:AcrR family transcriptional regulator